GPPLLTFLWFSVFGGSAIHAEMQGIGAVATAVNENISTARFNLLQNYPAATVTSFIGMTLVFVFFITSSDSGSLVIDIITAGGDLNPPVAQRIFWALTEGVVAAVLLAGGGLLALQTAAISTGLPFAIVIGFMGLGLYRAFNEELPSQRAIRSRVNTDRPE
ncbi:MAG TPA: BCCT family transporter, partial [Xanthomonadales bacterium]|nr:BCCT family transporter [Xanthomonadales bacterium]